MPYVPLVLPPGVVRPGTVYDARGRYYDTNLVRWEDGILQPWGGWTLVEAAAGIADPVRGMLGRRTSTTPFLRVALGTYDSAFVWAADTGVLVDITPAGFTAGRKNAVAVTGLTVEASAWTFDVWGEDLLGCMYEDGLIYRQPSTSPSNDFVEIDSSAPQGNSAIVVTAEKFLFALGAARSPRSVVWCDQDDFTEWTPASGNQAGDFEIPGSGWLMNGKRGRGETLLWTDTELWTARYTGDSIVYRFDKAGDACGPVSRRAMAMVDGKGVWMGRRGFFMYDGFVRKIPCPVADYVFNRMTALQVSKVAAYPNPEFGEITWLYPTGLSASAECNSYVTYNYVLDVWYIGAIDRTDGIERGTFDGPYLASSTGAIYLHETGTTYQDEGGGTSTPYAESGPVELGQGDNTFMIRQYVPDEETLGEVNTRLYTRFYPTATETTNGPYTNANPTDVRLTARQVRVRHTQVTGGWRVGTPRLEIVPGGLR